MQLSPFSSRFDVQHRSSKHSGVLAIFDREFVHTGRLDVRFSKLFHRLFEERQKADYKELIEVTHGDAVEAVKDAREFCLAVKHLIDAP